MLRNYVKMKTNVQRPLFSKNKFTPTPIHSKFYKNKTTNDQTHTQLHEN